MGRRLGGSLMDHRAMRSALMSREGRGVGPVGPAIKEKGAKDESSAPHRHGDDFEKERAGPTRSSRPQVGQGGGSGSWRETLPSASSA